MIENLIAPILPSSDVSSIASSLGFGRFSRELGQGEKNEDDGKAWGNGEN